MPDSGSTDTERGVQPIFSKASLFSYLALVILFAIVLVVGKSLKGPEVRSELPRTQAAVRFTPVSFDGAGFAPLQFAGAWKVEVADRRFGGVSALAIDRGMLLALTDAGSLIRLPRPGTGQEAAVADLPDGPGIPRYKVDRDTEALSRDPAGRGWWISFEHWHEIWLYDPAFRRAVAKIRLGQDRWPKNRGVEGLVADRDGLTLFAESGVEWLRWSNRQLRSHKLENEFGFVSDAVRLPDGRLLAVTRSFGALGIAKQIAMVENVAGQLRLKSLAPLPLGATDNVEGIAAEPRTQGGMRLWLITDNDFRPRQPTLLVALDMP
jgi:hypothetical protein